MNVRRCKPLPPTVRRLWLCAALLILATATAAPQEPCRSPDAESPAFSVEERDGPSFALSSLQAAQTAGEEAFVVQGELDPLIREGGGGGCASAAGIDLL